MIWESSKWWSETGNDCRVDGRSSVKHMMMGGKKFKEMRGQDIEGSSTYLNFQELLQE